MNKKRSMRGIYIVLVPSVLFLFIMNLGILQKKMMAVSLENESYTIAEYNYYYYNSYFDFVNNHSNEELMALGFSTTKDPKKQNYNEESTWGDVFLNAAIERIEKISFYYTLGQNANFAFDTTKRVKEKLLEIDEFCSLYGITDREEYFTSYYGTGFTESVYVQQYQRELYAEAYEEEYKNSLQYNEDEVQNFIAENYEGNDYQTIGVYYIVLNPETDIETEQIEERQWENVEIKAEKLLDLYAEENPGEDTFLQLAQVYSQSEEYSKDTVTRDDFDDEITSWCFDETRTAGDVQGFRWNDSYYVIYFAGESFEQAFEYQAKEELKELECEKLYNAYKTEVNMTIHSLAMRLA